MTTFQLSAFLSIACLVSACQSAGKKPLAAYATVQKSPPKTLNQLLGSLSPSERRTRSVTHVFEMQQFTSVLKTYVWEPHSGPWVRYVAADSLQELHDQFLTHYSDSGAALGDSIQVVTFGNLTAQFIYTLLQHGFKDVKEVRRDTNLQLMGGQTIRP